MHSPIATSRRSNALIAAAMLLSALALSLAPSPAGAQRAAPPAAPPAARPGPAQVAVPPAASAKIVPEKVAFTSADGKTKLVGYLFRPPGQHAARTPAVVMMHGRGGAYSSTAAGVYDANTLTLRHQMWGTTWARQGYAALLVDSFSPRGYPTGFAKGSYDNRPDSLDEVTVRPLDAYGALAWLRKRPDVAPDKIALQGWSNGGSATLATMAMQQAPGIGALTPANGFRGALAFYPGCGLKNQYRDGITPYAPVRLFQGSADEEVSPKICADLVEKSRKRRGDIESTFFPNATHDFDDPGAKRQSVPANASARADATAKSTAFFHALFDK